MVDEFALHLIVHDSYNGKLISGPLEWEDIIDVAAAHIDDVEVQLGRPTQDSSEEIWFVTRHRSIGVCRLKKKRRIPKRAFNFGIHDQTMTSRNPHWQRFLSGLWEYCQVALLPDPASRQPKMKWDCVHEFFGVPDVLRSMGFTEKAIEHSMAHFRTNNLKCDCAVLFNTPWQENGDPPYYDDGEEAVEGSREEILLDRVFRGGYWNFYARNCRSANRNYYSSDYHDYSIGVRVCAEVVTRSYCARRGGSWHYNARSCRSALRNYYSSDYRNYSIGVRVCAEVVTRSYCVRRGGSWHYDARTCRSAFRDHDSPDYRDHHIGVRLVCYEEDRDSVTRGGSTTSEVDCDDLLTSARNNWSNTRSPWGIW